MGKKKKYFFLASLTLCIYLNNKRLTKRHIPYYKGEKRFNKAFKVLHLSDLHNSEFGIQNSRLIKLIQASRPNVIAVTGDLINSYSPNEKRALDFMREIRMIAPVFYVSGNHEARGDYEEFFKKIERLGIHLVHNRYFQMTHEGKTIQIAGLKDPTLDPHYEASVARLGKLLNPEHFSLVLAHRPEYIDIYQEAGFDLVLSGHAHGGQWRIPFLGGIYAPNQGFFPKYTSGLYEGSTSMIVSRGLGNSLFPFRLNNYPEVIELTLESFD